MITHIVFFKLRDPSTANLEEARSRLAGLAGQVPQVRHLEVGVDVVRSERSYDLALLARFDSLADLQAYQAHPAHQEVVAFLNTVRESVAVVDYES